MPERTLAIGHRGLAAVAPENTLASFEAALEAGADMIEIDVQRTSDGHLVVIHDELLDRTTNGRGWVRAHTLSELRELDAGRWFGASFAGQRIPTLDEVLDFVRGRLQLNIELKSTHYLDPGLERDTVEAVKRASLLQDVLFSSFDHYLLKSLRLAEAAARIGILYVAGTGSAVELAAWAGANALNPYYPFCTPELVEQATRAGLEVYTWTVNEPHLATAIAGFGVNGVITDRGDVLAAIRGG